MDLTTISGTPNGELITYSDNTGSSLFSLNYGGYGQIDGIIDSVDLPPVTDANGNGFNDFFEVSQGVASTLTTGHYYTDDGFSEGTITATWSRAAGSKDGTCVLNFDDDTYGDLGDYTCTFTVLEYTGPLTYAPGPNTVSANINLTQTGNPASTLQGAINFDKSGDPNTLTNQPGVWTNAASQMLTFDREIFSHDSTWPTNYYGLVLFDDGDPGTADPDYTAWELSIDDTNDANTNGIPDFSDAVGSVTPRASQLSLAVGATNLLLTISGDTGHTNEIQETASLAPSDWQTTLSLTLTNDPQVISLPLPSGQTWFWRVLAR